MTTVQVQRIAAVLLFVVSAALAAGCIAGGSSNQASGNGTITFVEAEGGFFGLVTDGGPRYLPLNISAEYQENGLRVWFTGSTQSRTTTSPQWGVPLKIVAMGRINEETTVVAPTIAGLGSIRFIPLEGGFYGIDADDGDQYYPINLDDQYRVDGKRISFSAELSDEVTVVMWGEPVRITEIEGIGFCPACHG